MHELVDQLREGASFVRRHRVIAWSLTYLGIASSLIGVLGAIGPGFAVDILRLSETDFFFIMAPRLRSIPSMITASTAAWTVQGLGKLLHSNLALGQR